MIDKFIVQIILSRREIYAILGFKVNKPKILIKFKLVLLKE